MASARPEHKPGLPQGTPPAPPQVSGRVGGKTSYYCPLRSVGSSTKDTVSFLGGRALAYEKSKHTVNCSHDQRDMSSSVQLNFNSQYTLCNCNLIQSLRNRLFSNSGSFL